MSNGVTEQEVHSACRRLDEAGQRCTAERVRQELGARGSYTTIRKYVLSWEKGQSAADVPPLPAAFDKVVGDFVAQMWIASYREAASHAAEAFTALKTEATVAEVERRELLDFNELLEKELTAGYAAIADLTCRLAAAEERATTVEAALRESEAENQMLLGKLVALESIIERIQAPPHGVQASGGDQAEKQNSFTIQSDRRSEGCSSSHDQQKADAGMVPFCPEI